MGIYGLRAVCESNGLPKRIVGKCICYISSEELIVGAKIVDNLGKGDSKRIYLVVTLAVHCDPTPVNITPGQKILHFEFDRETLKFKKEIDFTIE